MMFFGVIFIYSVSIESYFVWISRPCVLSVYFHCFVFFG